MCSIVKEKKNRASHTTGVRWVRCFRFVNACAFVVDGLRCRCRRRVAVVRVPGGRWKTGNAAHRIDSHALPRRSEYWSRRFPAHVVRYVAMPHDKESVFKKKKKTFMYPTKCTTIAMTGGGDFFTYKRQEPLGRRPRRMLDFIFLFPPLL